MRITSGTMLGALLAVALAATAAPLKTDSANSAVNVEFKQMGVTAKAAFRKFAARIDYDPAKPETSRASMEIETASLDVGEAELTREVAKKEWFNSAQYPKATFVSSSIKPAGPGRLNVTGKLSIKGKTGDVSFPLTVKNEAGKQVFEGALPIRRLTYNIGEGEWKDTSMVADEVTIRFRITAAQ